MYGVRIDNIRLYEILFSYGTSFKHYESIFHLLKKNDYYNALLCPMGGVNTRDIDWSSINRLFQSDVNIDCTSIDYKGQTTPFFGTKDRYCLPDQYSLNFTYDKLRKECATPFSLFFCTMNSHIPYQSPLQTAKNWKDLNSPEFKYETTTDNNAKIKQRYLASIKYQLETAFDFILGNKDDDLVVVMFGDHQPPLITNEKFGLETPVHVISKQTRFNDVFESNGFVSGFDLAEQHTFLKHEGFMSVFANAYQQAYGQDPKVHFPILPDGNDMFKDIGLDT